MESCAIVIDAGAVIHNPSLVVDISNTPDPIPRLFGSLCVGIVCGVSRESGAHVEKDAIGDCCKMAG